MNIGQRPNSRSDRGARANANGTAGPLFHRSSASDDSANTVCEPSTDIFVVITFDRVSPGVEKMLRDALTRAEESIIAGGRIMPAGGWRQLGGRGEALVVTSQAGQVITYEILRSALHALIIWMTRPGRSFGSCSFTIWDGAVMVGRGLISLSL